MSTTIISWDNEYNQKNYILFDCVLVINHESTAQITDSPTDGGAPVADHGFLNPKKINISGVISNTPLPSNPSVGAPNEFTGPGFMSEQTLELNPPEAPPIAPPYTPGGLNALAVGAVSAGIDLLLGNSENRSAVVWKANSYRDRVRAVFDKLKKMQADLSRCTVETERATLDNMVLTALTLPEDLDSGDSGSFSLEFNQILTANTESVETPEPAEKRGAPPRSGSKSTEKPADEDDKTQRSRSILKGVFG